uniref:Ig-like domain-containing protein n=1 Tax=Cyprinus carpio TaxID=7962 RepID=A0A8C2F126_CYPCA
MALWKNAILIVVLYIWGCNSQDKVDQHTRIQSAFEGDSVTINCTYQTTVTNPTLFWYQQKVSGIPKYMLNKFSKSGNSEEEFKERFHANLSTTSVPLTIQDVRVSDSAVYYCALQPTVTETHSKLIQELQQCNSIYYMQLNMFCLVCDFIYKTPSSINIFYFSRFLSLKFYIQFT